jgi:hypothetical protein
VPSDTSLTSYGALSVNAIAASISLYHTIATLPHYQELCQRQGVAGEEGCVAYGVGALVGWNESSLEQEAVLDMVSAPALHPPGGGSRMSRSSVLGGVVLSDSAPNATVLSAEALQLLLLLQAGDEESNLEESVLELELEIVKAVQHFSSPFVKVYVNTPRSYADEQSRGTKEVRYCLLPSLPPYIPCYSLILSHTLPAHSFLGFLYRITNSSLPRSY